MCVTKWENQIPVRVLCLAPGLDFAAFLFFMSVDKIKIIIRNSRYLTVMDGSAETELSVCWFPEK